jgi:lipoate-protein ligase A
LRQLVYVIIDTILPNPKLKVLAINYSLVVKGRKVSGNAQNETSFDKLNYMLKVKVKV